MYLNFSKHSFQITKAESMNMFIIFVISTKHKNKLTFVNK